MYKCFRPGDVVLAEVISLGDARTYYLSVARNDLGVIYATSVAGAFSFRCLPWEKGWGGGGEGGRRGWFYRIYVA